MITLLTLLIATAWAGSSNWYPVGKVDGNHYTRKKVCEKKESPIPCWDIRGKDIRYYEAGTIDVDDFSQPLYEAESVVSVCTDQDSCSAIISETYCLDGGASDQHFVIVAEDFSRIYCTKLTGYVQVNVAALVINKANKDAADAADAAKKQEKTSRRNKRGSRLTALEACARTAAADYTALQLRQCVRRISKELVRDRLQESEL